MENIVEYKQNSERKISDKMLEKINEIKEHGVLDAEIFEALHISAPTFYRRIKTGKWKDREIQMLQGMWVGKDGHGILTLVTSHV